MTKIEQSNIHIDAASFRGNEKLLQEITDAMKAITPTQIAEWARAAEEERESAK